MENICSFEPLWKNFESDAPQNEIASIRLESMKIFLRENEFFDIQQPPNMDYIVAESLKVMKHLLSFWKGYNPIIARLRTVAIQTEADPIIAVKGAIALWYTSSVSILKRDIHQGVSSEEEIATFEDGTVVATWNRDFAAEKHYVGNLGLMAMLLTTEVWLPPKDPRLQVASLVSCGATTMLFAAYMISSRMPTFNAWRPALTVCPGTDGMKLFLQSAWRLAQKPVDEAGAPPGIDFGAHVDEIRLCRNGKGLLSKVGRADWGRAPFWHPCRKIPGSHWNKWIKNTCRPIFPKSPGDRSRDICIVFRLPSSAAVLTSVFGDYYSNLRTRFDQTNRPRSQLTLEECEKQFHDLAAKTGCEYPSLIPALETAASVHHLDQEYLYNLPMVKKPISDPTGNLTLPFLTTAIRALRFGEDPDEIEQNLFMMTFSLTILSI